MTPAQRAVAGILAAAAVAIPVIATYEGSEPVGYPDPGVGVALPTACTGHTGGVVIGRRYTEAQCSAWLAEDAVKHGLDIGACLPASLPIDTHAAFISFGFNVGAAKFCSSTLSRKARAGDLAGACAELSKWTYAGGRQLTGLVRRRKAERALCERGLTP